MAIQPSYEQPRINGIDLPYVTAIDFRRRVGEVDMVDVEMYVNDHNLPTEFDTKAAFIDFCITTPEGRSLCFRAYDVFYNDPKEEATDG